MSNDSSHANLFLWALGFLFITLKLTGYIDWSWWLVLLPIYGGIAFFLAIFLIGVLGISFWAVCLFLWTSLKERFK